MHTLPSPTPTPRSLAPHPVPQINLSRQPPCFDTFVWEEPGQLWAPSRRAGLIPRSKPCVVQEILTLDLCRTTLRKTPQSITDNGGRGRWGFNCALVEQRRGRGALPPSLLTTFIFKGTTGFIAWLLFNSHNFMIPLQF